MRSALVEEEEAKQPDVDFESLPDPIRALGEVITPQDMSKMFLGLGDQLDHLPRKLHEWVTARKQDYGGSLKKYTEHMYITLAKELSNEGVADQIHEGFDPTVALQDPFQDGVTRLCEAVLEADRSSWQAFSEPLKPLATKVVGGAVDELRDGFSTGVEGVFAWFQANATRHYMKTLPQMQAMMKVGPMVFLLRSQYTKYQQSLEAGQ